MTKDKDVGIKEVETAVKKIDKNLEKIGLQLQPEKTQLVDFNRTENIEERVKIKLKGYTIRGQEKVKFLGIVFDNKFKCSEQIEEIKGKVSKAVSILKYLNKVSWGMELNTAVMIYKSYVMEYGMFVYFPRDLRRKEILEKLQYRGIRTAMGYRNSTQLIL